MSFPADSFFDVWTTLTFTIVFTGTLFVTYLAPMNINPGAVAFPKYVWVCDDFGRNCHWVEIPFNFLWGGLINGATYGTLGTIGYIGVRSIWRKIK